ncbi:MAG: hypothetical protein KDK76_06570 [Chlamydiia bacterium]|nr:hypothetical protein [Chlamydiia bacterium]
MAAVGHQPAVRHEQFEDYIGVTFVKRRSIELALGASLVNAIWNAYHIKIVQTAINVSLAGTIMLVHSEVERGLTANLVQDAEEHVTNARDAAREARMAFRDIEERFGKAKEEVLTQLHQQKNDLVVQTESLTENVNNLKGTKESLDQTVEEQKKQIEKQNAILEGMKATQENITQASANLARSLSSSQIVQLGNGGNNQK